MRSNNITVGAKFNLAVLKREGWARKNKGEEVVSLSGEQRKHLNRLFWQPLLKRQPDLHLPISYLIPNFWPYDHDYHGRLPIHIFYIQQELLVVQAIILGSGETRLMPGSAPVRLQLRIKLKLGLGSPNNINNIRSAAVHIEPESIFFIVLSKNYYPNYACNKMRKITVFHFHFIG